LKKHNKQYKGGVGVVYIPLGIQVFFMFFMLLAAGMAYEAYIRPKIFVHVFIPIKKREERVNQT
jgi:hypothetical protein